MPEASFAIYLLVLLLAGIVLSTWQARRYGRQVRDLVRAHRGEDLHLVSGCGKGVARGAVVLLLVDPVHETIVEARAMTGGLCLRPYSPRPESGGTNHGRRQPCRESTVG